MKKIHLYFRVEPRKDRFFYGDRYLLGLIKKLFYKKKISGVEKVFLNLCKGFDQLKINYDVNLPFKKIKPGEPVVVLGYGKYALKGYNISNPLIAGVGLMTHPNDWPDIFKEYPVAKYLQHSEWTKNIYSRHYEPDKCGLWPAGIDTEKWKPAEQPLKKYDLLVYNKIMWNKPQTENTLKTPILKKLDEMGISYKEITYGNYIEPEYYSSLNDCRAMIFLCEHESQGFACCEALSMNVPVFAWDQGYWLDPNRFVWNDPVIPATSVPFFDDRCGMRFKDFQDFEKLINNFWSGVKNDDFKPREYVLENLTLKHSAQNMLNITESIYK